MGTKKRKNRWAHDGRGAHEISKKNGRQKMKKTMGSAPFLQIHFFRAHDPRIPTAGAHEAPGTHISKILYIFFSHWRGPQQGPRRFIVKIRSNFYRWNQGILTIS